MTRVMRQQLTKFHADLSAIEPTQANWQRIKRWVTGFQPFLRRSFPENLTHFDKLAIEPDWLSLPVVGDTDSAPDIEEITQAEVAENDHRVRDVKETLLAFLDGLMRITEDEQAEVAPVPLASSTETTVTNADEVFVIHGRNLAARDAMFDFLRALGLRPLEWDDVVKKMNKVAPYIGEVLDVAFSTAQAVVAILTGDDVACLREELQQLHDPEYEKQPSAQARANVLFEAGMAFGSHPDRTILVQIGRLRPFSDIAGRQILQFSGTPENLQTLRDRLKSARCSIKESGTDWLRRGRFDEAVRLGMPSPTEKGASRETTNASGRNIRISPKKQRSLSQEATEVLLRATNTTGGNQGCVIFSEHIEGLTISAGNSRWTIQPDDARKQAKYRRAIKELVARRLLEERFQDVFEVTDNGYIVAERIHAKRGHAYVGKVPRREEAAKFIDEFFQTMAEGFLEFQDLLRRRHSFVRTDVVGELFISEIPDAPARQIGKEGSRDFPELLTCR
jgi:predicted nucleotide-binding protein